MSSSFTTYRSPFLILCYSWEALESGKGLNIRVNGVILHFDMPHIISPSISLLAEECGDFLPPCISSPHPFALSSCHNVVQVGRHSGWTDCTIPSNSLIFKFIYWLSFVQQWWATTAWGDGRKKKKSREQVDGGRLFMTNWCCTAWLVKVKQSHFPSSILYWPRLQMNFQVIDHLVSNILACTCHSNMCKYARISKVG